MRRFTLEFERPIIEIEERLKKLKKLRSAGEPSIARDIEALEFEVEKLRKQVYSKLTPWQRVQVARHPDRPRTLDYIEACFVDFMELSGDRQYGDDPSIIAGLARIEHQKVVIIGHQKGKNTKENVARNFGMPHPEGFRKALRVMKLAEKFRLPVVSFIDTPGAYPGVGAEERGQSLAIANNLLEMSHLATPVVAINIGEGGSGGALAIGLGDRIFMLENAYYSVISPEGCASILWRDESKAAAAAKALCLTAGRLKKFGLIDDVIKEPVGGAHQAPALMARNLKKAVLQSLRDLTAIPATELVERRYKRLRQIGQYQLEDPIVTTK